MRASSYSLWRSGHDFIGSDRHSCRSLRARSLPLILFMTPRAIPFQFSLFLALPGTASVSLADDGDERLGAPSSTAINDWLLRRAALLEKDSSARASLYARITSPVVRARLQETEALAREQLGDLSGAISCPEQARNTAGLKASDTRFVKQDT